MNHNWIPDNDELARRLATAFDALPGPDEERLEAVRARLASQLKRPSSRSHGKRWIWLLLLMGGTATAAWWIGEVWQSPTNKQSFEQQSASSSLRSTTDEMEESHQQQSRTEDTNRKSLDEQHSPVIYRQEHF